VIVKPVRTHVSFAVPGEEDRAMARAYPRLWGNAMARRDN